MPPVTDFVLQGLAADYTKAVGFGKIFYNYCCLGHDLVLSCLLPVVIVVVVCCSVVANES